MNFRIHDLVARIYTKAAKGFNVSMNNFKNLLILTLTARLGLSLFVQPAQSASTSKTAKAIQYEMCFSYFIDGQRVSFVGILSECKEYKP